MDPEEFKMEEEEDASISPSAPEPTDLSQFLERVGDHESMFDYILELMDYGKHKIQPAVYKDRQKKINEIYTSQFKSDYKAIRKGRCDDANLRGF